MGFLKTDLLALPRKSKYFLQNEIFGRYQASNFNLHSRNYLDSWNDDVTQNTVMGNCQAWLKNNQT